jgi:prefoldin subunit 5
VSGFGSRLDALEAQVTEGFQKVAAELKLINRKLEIMTQDIMDMRARVRDVEHRMDDVENEVRAKAS